MAGSLTTASVPAPSSWSMGWMGGGKVSCSWRFSSACSSPTVRNLVAALGAWASWRMFSCLAGPLGGPIWGREALTGNEGFALALTSRGPQARAERLWCWDCIAVVVVVVLAASGWWLFKWSSAGGGGCCCWEEGEVELAAEAKTRKMGWKMATTKATTASKNLEALPPGPLDELRCPSRAMSAPSDLRALSTDPCTAAPAVSSPSSPFDGRRQSRSAHPCPLVSMATTTDQTANKEGNTCAEKTRQQSKKIYIYIYI